MNNGKLTQQQVFKAAQKPSSWLLSAENLQEAAEIVITHEDQFLIPYLRAHDAASQEAVGIAYAEGNKSGHAEIKARTPNYLPAQALYAYAIENVLKGLIVAKNPSIIDGDKLNAVLKDHDLIALAMRADFAVYVQEESVLKALSKLSVWAGRYPAARHAAEFFGVANPDELMDYGSRHTIMRDFFKRAYKVLEAQLPQPIGSRFSVVVVLRQPGT